MVTLIFRQFVIRTIGNVFDTGRSLNDFRISLVGEQMAETHTRDTGVI